MTTINSTREYTFCYSDLMSKDTCLLYGYVATLLLSPIPLMTAEQKTPTFTTMLMLSVLLLTGGSGIISFIGWRCSVRSYWLTKMLIASTITALFGLVLITFTFARVW